MRHEPSFLDVQIEQTTKLLDTLRLLKISESLEDLSAIADNLTTRRTTPYGGVVCRAAAADAVGVSAFTITRWFERGLISGYRKGNGTLVIYTASLLQYQESRYAKASGYGKSASDPHEPSTDARRVT